MPHPLDVPLPLTEGLAGIFCVVTHTEKRVKVTVVLVREGRVTEEFHARVGVTLWRGLLLPALTQFAALQGLDFAVRETEMNPIRATRPTGE